MKGISRTGPALPRTGADARTTQAVRQRASTIRDIL